jgi:hypothetical protein
MQTTQPTTKTGGKQKLITGIVLIVLGLLGWWYIAGTPKTTPSPTTTATTTATTTTEVVRSPLTPDQNGHVGPYRITADGVYFHDPQDTVGKKIEGADPATFQVIVYDEKSAPNIIYAKDKNSVYVFNKRIQGADPATFRILSPGKQYSGDSTSVFVYDFESIQKIVGADPNTFTALKEAGYNPCTTGLYSKDTKNIYFVAEAIPGADPSTFEALGFNYGKDSKRVYKGIRVENGVEPLTFEPPSCSEMLKDY